MENLKYDIAVASYILDPTVGKYPIENIIEQYLGINVNNYLEQNGVDLQKTKQITLFENQENEVNTELYQNTFYAYAIFELSNVLSQKLAEIEAKELFEKMGLTAVKKTKSGYSTAEDVLEKIKSESPIIEKILDYRQLAKLNSTYVEGMRPYINPKTKRIHSFFHQTITATRKNKLNRTKFTKHTNKNRTRKKTKKSIHPRRRKNLHRCRLLTNRTKSPSPHVRR